MTLATSSCPTSPATLPSFHARTAITFLPGLRCFLTSTVWATVHSLPTSTFLPLMYASKPLSQDIVSLADLVSLFSLMAFRKNTVSPSLAFLELQIHLGWSATAPPAAITKSPASPMNLARRLPDCLCRKDMAAKPSGSAEKRQQKSRRLNRCRCAATLRHACGDIYP